MAVGMLNATVFASSPLHGIEVKKKKKKNTCFLHVSASLNEPIPIPSIPTFS